MDTQVAIVGAGPTGLLLAGDLASAGIGCTVLERRAETSNLTRAFAVHARTLEQLDARGMADDLIGTGQVVDRLRLFGGIDIDLSRLSTRFPFALVTPQTHTEALLMSRARDAGVRFETGVHVHSVRNTRDGVLVRGDRHGLAVQLAAEYAIGADGAHSSVRKALGLQFEGHAAVQSVMLADVRLQSQPEDVLIVDATEDGFAFIAPFGDGWYRIIAWDRGNQQPDSAPVSLAEVSDITRRVLGFDYGMHRARWLSRFHSDERQVDAYRVGRVFLAGDAAHVHSPAGGQGMNTGLQDAANLSWKLASEVGGHTGPGAVLDSYHAERHPVGASVLRSSSALLRAAMLRSGTARGLRYVVGHAAQRIPPVMNRVAETISGVGVHYPSDLPGGGVRAGDVAVTELDGTSTRLYAALRMRKFIWVRPAGPAAMTIAHPMVHNVDASSGGTGYGLVRPDGHFAFRPADQGSPSAGEVRAALRGWLPSDQKEPVEIS